MSSILPYCILLLYFTTHWLNTCNVLHAITNTILHAATFLHTLWSPPKSKTVPPKCLRPEVRICRAGKKTGQAVKTADQAVKNNRPGSQDSKTAGQAVWGCVGKRAMFSLCALGSGGHLSRVSESLSGVGANTFSMFSSMLSSISGSVGLRTGSGTALMPPGSCNK